MNNPTPNEVKKLREFVQTRENLGITAAQKYCAELIYKGLRTWQQWENGDRKMDAAFFELASAKIHKPT